MGFKGVDKKTGMMITIVYVMVAYVISLITSLQVSMIMISLGMMAAGFLGIKNNSYAFIRADDMKTTSNKMSGFISYMNWLLLFLGVVLMVQQF